MRVGGLPRSVVLLALTSLFGDVSSEMLYPVLPLFITRELAAPASVVGVIEGVAQATQNIVQAGSGWLADRLGRNKPVALTGYALAALAKPTIGLATVWPHVLAGRFVDRLGTGIRSAPRDALIAGAVDSSRRGAAFGLEGVGDNLGAVLGPLLAAALLYVLVVPLRSMFFIAFIPGTIAFLLVVLVRETPRPAGARPDRLGLRALPSEYWRYLAAVAVFGVGNLSSAFAILRATDLGLPTEQTLLVYAAYNLVAALVSYPIGRLSDRFGRRRLLLAAFIVLALSFGGFAIASTGVAVALLFLLYGVYQGAFRSLGKALAVDLAPDTLRGSAVGLFGTVVGLAALVAGTVGGQLWDRAGPGATFAYGGAFAILGAALLAVVLPGQRPQRGDSPSSV